MEQKKSVNTSAKNPLRKNKAEVILNEKKSNKQVLKKKISKAETYADFDFYAGKNSKKLAEVKSAKASKNLEPKAKPEEKSLKIKAIIENSIKIANANIDLKKVKIKAKTSDMSALKINDKNAVLETENAVKENFEQNENLKTNNTKAKIKGLKFTAETLLRQQKFLNEVKIQVAKKQFKDRLEIAKRYNPEISSAEIKSQFASSKLEEFISNDGFDNCQVCADGTIECSVVVPETNNLCFSEDVERIINIARVGALFDCEKI